MSAGIEDDTLELAIYGDERITVLVNSNVKMSRGKAAAQAIHAVLNMYGIPHGSVVVLGGSPAEIGAMPVQIRDAGRTEIERGTLTAGARMESPSAGEQ